MGLLDVLNGMQQGPRGPSNSSAQSSGGMSPMTMAILALLAYKAVKRLGGVPERDVARRIAQGSQPVSARRDRPFDAGRAAANRTGAIGTDLNSARYIDAVSRRPVSGRLLTPCTFRKGRQS